MVLSVGGLAGRRDHRAADPHGRRRAGDIHVTLADRQHLTDACRGPNMTSMIASSCPSGLGPDSPAPRRQLRTASLMASTWVMVSAMAVEGGRRSREVPTT